MLSFPRDQEPGKRLLTETPLQGHTAEGMHVSTVMAADPITTQSLSQIHKCLFDFVRGDRVLSFFRSSTSTPTQSASQGVAK